MSGKSELRQTLRQRRSALGPGDRSRLSQQVCAHAARHPWFQRPTCVALYAAIQDELNPAELAAWLTARGTQCVYPHVTPAGRHDVLLTFALAHAETRWKIGAFGVPEPMGPPVPLQHIDLVVLPGLGFDTAGTRLGYGAGFYDRTLQNHPARRVGLAFSCQIVPELPAGPFDMPVHMIMTEHGGVATAADLHASASAGTP